MVYVISKDEKPLMPTERYGKVRRMLRDGLAVVKNRDPFTIQLTYDTTNYVQPVTLGVDAGYEKIGISAVTDFIELYACEIELLKKHAQTSQRKSDVPKAAKEQKKTQGGQVQQQEKT